MSIEPPQQGKAGDILLYFKANLITIFLEKTLIQTI